MKKLVILLFVFLAGCVTSNEVKIKPEETQAYVSSQRTFEPVYVQTPLQLPIRPIWPKIRGKDMRCLSPTTQWELKNRDTIMREYISQLETIIKSTHE